MTDPQLLFFTVFAAVLAAIILGGTFWWGIIAYGRHEKAGTAGRKESHAPLFGILVPLGVLALLLPVVFGEPSWMQAVFQ